MKGLNSVGLGRVAVCAASLLVAATAMAAEPPIVEMEAQVLAEGITADEYFAQQSALYDLLTAMLPGGVMDDVIRVQVTAEDLADIAAATTPMRIGVVKPVAPAVAVTDLRLDRLTVRAGGSVIELTDGGYVWARSITSEGAGGIRIGLSNVSLPAGVSLYFFSAEGEAYGPYEGSGPSADGEFWSESIFSSTGILLLEVPGYVDPADLRRASLTIANVGHIDPSFVTGVIGDEAGGTRGGFCGNLSCIVDATCFNVPAANPCKLAVAKMEWISGPYIYTCTGGLLSDNNPSQNNYFLTANHCISKNNNASNVQFYWRFATSSCNGACPSNSGWPYKTTGSAVRKTGRRGDFTLLQLNSNPPAGSVFLGWTSAPVANSNGTQLYRISNPNFGPQVYSQHNVDTSAPTCTGWPRGERIYSRNITGGIDGGSSGSPVVNGSSQVVGQLSGTCGFNPGDPCDSGSNATVDGAFAYYYSLVQPFLNP